MQKNTQSGQKEAHVSSIDFRIAKEGELALWEQRLLARKFDCEDGPLCRQVLKFIAWRKPVASAQFLSGLATIHAEAVLSETSKRATPPVSLWDGVAARIKQEERAQFLLGHKHGAATDFISKAFEVFDSVSGYRTFGAVTAAILGALLFVYLPRTDDLKRTAKVSLPQAIENYIPPQLIPDVKSVSLGLQSLNEATRSEFPSGDFSRVDSLAANVPHEIPQSVAVDWIRSKGSVRFVQNPQKQVSVMWVSPRGNTYGGNSFASEASSSFPRVQRTDAALTR